MATLVTPTIFWSRVDFRGPDECAIYIGPGQVTKSGHIRISVAGRKTYSHRYALRLVNGYWPECALHHCDVPACANPAHLYDGDQRQNVRDREERNRRSPYLPRRPQHWSSRLTQRDIDEVIEARALGIRATVLAAEYRVSAETIRSVWRRAALEGALQVAA